MSATVFGEIACDLEEVAVPANGGDWRMGWHPPGDAPPGQPHGANAFCVTFDGEVVLIGPDGMEDGAGPIYSRAAREAGLA